MYHSLLVILILSGVTLSLQAQSVEIIGKIVGGQERRPVEFATVTVMDEATQSMLTGTTTDLEGNFQLTTEATDFYLEVSFIGFTPRIIRGFQAEDGVIDLDEVLLQESSQTLDEVIVRAEKSQTEFALDKRVFNVGKDLSSTGASALEVLNNVPSVNVDIEGQISLRGSTGVQVLINGKPSVLTSEGGNALGTITADMIEKIEVITNPSAKYDAEGTSGILNIVIKKDEREGLNGSATLNVGTPKNHSVGLSLNRRTDHFNMFAQLGVGTRELPNDRRIINRDLLSGTELNSVGREFRNEQFYNVILGTDYHINDFNVITLSGHFAYEIEDQPSSTDFSFFNEIGELTDRWNRKEDTEATNPKYQYELNYKSEIDGDEDHTFLFSALGSLFSKDQSSVFNNTTLLGDRQDFTQNTRTDFGEVEYTFKLDYTRPFAEVWTMEVGAQTVINDVSNDFAVENFLDGVWETDPNQTNIFEFDQKVWGAYATGAYEGDQWGIKLGLRTEYTDLNTYLINTDQTNDQDYTNFFPTVHTSYKWSDQFSLQAGYSRRIFRPRLWDLNPFFNIRNNFSIRVGNPNLLPEYTDSYEITAISIFGQTSMNFGVYYRYTTDVVERVATFSENVQTTRPLNIGTNGTTGVEWNGKFIPSDWLTLNGDLNINFFNRQGELEGRSFDFTGNQWMTKWTAKTKLPAGIDFEVTGQYMSSFQTVQGEVADMLWADLGLRKKLLGGKGVINLSVRDVFASRIRERETIQPNFYLYNRDLRGRFVVLGFSYGFGKGEAMEFSGQKRF